MKLLWAKILLILLVLIGSVGLTDNATAQYTGPAYGAPWTTFINYMNVGDKDASNVTMMIYPEGSDSAVTYHAGELEQNAAKSLRIRKVTGISQGFLGSVIMLSDVPIATTPVFYAYQNEQIGIGGRNVQIMSSGFSPDHASSKFLIPTVLNKDDIDTVSKVVIQNADFVANNVKIEFYAVGESDPDKVEDKELGPGSSWIIDASKIGLGNDFNGSAVVTVNNGSNEGKIVAFSTEYKKSQSGAYSFEGVPEGSNTLYMPSALCAQGGGTKDVDPETFYAIQNADRNQNATVKITYYDKNGKEVAKVENQTISSGGKASFRGCGKEGEYNGMPLNTVGSAIIESTGGEIVAIGKVSFAKLDTAFIAEKSGSNKLALPYIRWATLAEMNQGTRQRTYIAIQNINNEKDAQVSVRYYDHKGDEIVSQTFTIGPNLKVNTNPCKAERGTDADCVNGEKDYTFGYYGTDEGGGIIIEGGGDDQLIATVRVVSGDPATINEDSSNRTGEDYSGIHID